jgi:histone-binding protein RBBP4
MDFNYFNEYLFISGSDDKTIQLFDLRKSDRSLHSFESHNDQV